MSLHSHFAEGRCVLSFELFPPKSASGVETLYKTVDELQALQPDFFTCTYGAGGSTRDRTLSITATVKQKLGMPVASHLTCVGSTVDQLREYLQAAREKEIDYIVALRGDPPQGETEFKAVTGGLRYANELVALIKSEFPEFGILVAGYPEIHQEAPDAQTDLQNLVRKVSAGADVIVTQLFYDNEDFFRFRDDCEALGIDVPIVPGLLPVLSLKQIKRIASLCKAKLPSEFVSKLEQKDDPQWQFEVGVEQAMQQTQELLEQGVPGIHFYVLNKSDAVRRILENVTELSR